MWCECGDVAVEGAWMRHASRFGNMGVDESQHRSGLIVHGGHEGDIMHTGCQLDGGRAWGGFRRACVGPMSDMSIHYAGRGGILAIGDDR